MLNTPILKEIQQIVASFPSEKQKALLAELRKQSILMEAKRLDKGVKKNTISKQEIIEEVRAVRKLLYGKK